MDNTDPDNPIGCWWMNAEATVCSNFTCVAQIPMDELWAWCFPRLPASFCPGDRQ